MAAWQHLRMEITPIGRVVSSRAEAIDDDWLSVSCTIELDSAQVTAQAVQGIEAFSHVEVLYCFDRVSPDSVERGARHPRGNTAWPKVGILAQRAKNRPNRIGVTVCRLLRIDGLDLTVEGLDAIDGTPVIDIKPYMAEFAPRGPVRQPPWSHELMREYWTADDHTGRNAEATAVLVIVSRLRDPSHRPRFLQLSADFERWLADQPGFLAYEVVDGGAAMADRIHWRTMRDAVQANSAFAATDIAAGFAEIVAEYHATLGHHVTDLRG